MTPLDLVARRGARCDVAAKPPHCINGGGSLYLFASQSHSLRTCRDAAALRQAAQLRVVLSENNTWRNRCPRASSHSSRLALWPSWRPAAKTNQLKSSLWLTQSRSQASQATLANTSKAARLSLTKTGKQTLWPACSPSQVMRSSRPQQKGAQA